MNDSKEGEGTEVEKPVSTESQTNNFPPFPDIEDSDFDTDIKTEEREYYKLKYIDLNDIKNGRLHCTACDRHLGCSVLKVNNMKMHPMLRTLVCNTCHTFYNSGEFEKGDDGSELYCRWCGQGGQVYCCSDCPHVFCAKCIKRNLGPSKIKEIEQTDDWKCFKCTPQCIWDLRALCWATFRYCDFKNKIIDTTTDNELKEKYIAEVEKDVSTCCREKRKRQSIKKEKPAETKKKEEKQSDNSRKKEEPKKTTVLPMLQFPPSIQVKKFASMSEPEKKGQKRSASPKNRINIMSKPITIAPFIPPVRNTYPVAPKRMRIPAISLRPTPPPFEKRTFISYSPRLIKPNPQMTIPFTYMNQSTTNGYNSYLQTDNLNLSIDNLTQGLDMGAVAAMANRSGNDNSSNDDLVCTPDIPLEHLEPLCEVNEDNTDDEVECISAPTTAAKSVAKISKKLKNDDRNIIQMTSDDVTVNSVTGGLKFRVDPQTLSSNKMYRLPDGRVFAINPNPNMPGGYSATIVSFTENSESAVKKGTTYAAKVSAVSSVSQNSNQPSSSNRQGKAGTKPRPRMTAVRNSNKEPTQNKADTANKCDLKVPVEWYRFNLIDAVDALEYSLMRLKKLKKDATTTFLRGRTIAQTMALHRTLDRLLNTSETRFSEIRKNLNKGYKQYLNHKHANASAVDESDDDDVEILSNEGDDPIYIDENSLDSHKDDADNQEVELVSSDLNDSEERGNAVDPLQKDFLDVSEGNDNSEKTDAVPDGKSQCDLMCNETVLDKEIPSGDDNLEPNLNKDESSASVSKPSEIIDSEDKLSNKEESCDMEDTSKSISEKENESGEVIEANIAKFPDTSNENTNNDVQPPETNDENNASKDTEMDVDKRSTEQDNSKENDVEMSADIIDSLLNDGVDENNDDNKSVESGEFII